MTKPSLVISLDDAAVENLRSLMRTFGARDPVEMVETAVKTMNVLQRYVKDGVVILKNSDDGDEVELFFKKAPERLREEV